MSVEDRVREEIARDGPVPYERLVEAALYGPGGFYAGQGRAGRRGDFLTSPEVGPLFGAVVACGLDQWWEVLDRPEPFLVVDAGAGPGSLAAAVRAADPACTGALRYVMVERSDSQRQLHDERLPELESLPELPAPRAGPCIVVANELLDNLPFGLLERTPAGWCEVRVGTDGAGDLAEVLVPLDADPAVEAAAGARVPRQQAAAVWLAAARRLAGRGGRVIVFDYASSTASLAARPWTEWVRTYRRHARGGTPLQHLGAQDITCEVAVDQLGPPPDLDLSQAEWLRAHGIDELVEEGRRIWDERAAVGDLAAVRARSRVHEAAALLDPSGLGAFRVLEWAGEARD